MYKTIPNSGYNYQNQDQHWCTDIYNVRACIEKAGYTYSPVTHEQQAISCVRLSKYLKFLLVRVERQNVTITNSKAESQ